MLDPKDLRIDCYRNSTQTNCEVRITHIPTGEIFTCDKYPTEHRNKQEALEDLYRYLIRKELKKGNTISGKFTIE